MKVRAQRYRGRIEHIVIDGKAAATTWWHTCPGVNQASRIGSPEPDGGRHDAMNQGIAHAHRVICQVLHSADRFSGPDVVAQAVEALSGQGTGVRIVGLRDGLSCRARSKCGPIPSEPAQIRPASRLFRISIVLRIVVAAKIGGYDLTGIAADQEFKYCGPRLVACRLTIRCVLCEFDTTGVGSHPGTKRGLVICAGWRPSATSSGRRISHAYLRVEFTPLQQSILGNVFTRMSK